MTLRPYQKTAKEAIKKDLTIPGASLVVMPTASGKSHVIAATAALKSPILILQPSQELLRQNMQKLELLVNEKEIGIYSAAFGRRDIRKYTFATIQSVYKKAHLFTNFELILIDECHMLAPKNLDGMFMKFINEVNRLRNLC